MKRAETGNFFFGLMRRKKEKNRKKSNGDVCAVNDKEKNNEPEMGQLEREGKGLLSKERHRHATWYGLSVSNTDFGLF